MAADFAKGEGLHLMTAGLLVSLSSWSWALRAWMPMILPACRSQMDQLYFPSPTCNPIGGSTVGSGRSTLPTRTAGLQPKRLYFPAVLLMGCVQAAPAEIYEIAPPRRSEIRRGGNNRRRSNFCNQRNPAYLPNFCDYCGRAIFKELTTQTWKAGGGKCRTRRFRET